MTKFFIFIYFFTLFLTSFAINNPKCFVDSTNTTIAGYVVGYFKNSQKDATNLLEYLAEDLVILSPRSKKAQRNASTSLGGEICFTNNTSWRLKSSQPITYNIVVEDKFNFRKFKGQKYIITELSPLHEFVQAPQDIAIWNLLKNDDFENNNEDDDGIYTNLVSALLTVIIVELCLFVLLFLIITIRRIKAENKETKNDEEEIKTTASNLKQQTTNQSFQTQFPCQLREHENTSHKTSPQKTEDANNLHCNIDHAQSNPNKKNNILTAGELVVESAGMHLTNNVISQHNTELCAAVVDNMETINPSYCDVKNHATKKLPLKTVNDQQCDYMALEAVNNNVTADNYDQDSQSTQLVPGKTTNLLTQNVPVTEVCSMNLQLQESNDNKIESGSSVILKDTKADFIQTKSSYTKSCSKKKIGSISSFKPPISPKPGKNVSRNSNSDLKTHKQINQDDVTLLSVLTPKPKSDFLSKKSKEIMNFEFIQDNINGSNVNKQKSLLDVVETTVEDSSLDLKEPTVEESSMNVVEPTVEESSMNVVETTVEDYSIVVVETTIKDDGRSKENQNTVKSAPSVIVATKHSLMHSNKVSTLVSSHENIINYQKQCVKETASLVSGNNPPLKVTYSNSTRHSSIIEQTKQSLFNCTKNSKLVSSNENLSSYRIQRDKETEMLTKSVNVRSRTASIMDTFQNNSDNRSSFVKTTIVCKEKFQNQSLINNQNAALLSPLKDNVIVETTVEDSSVDVVETTVEDSSVDVVETTVEDSSVDVVETTVEDSSVDVVETTVEDSSDDVVETTVEDSSVDVVETTVEDSSLDVVETTVEDSSLDVVETIVEDSSVELKENIIPQISKTKVDQSTSSETKSDATETGSLAVLDCVMSDSNLEEFQNNVKNPNSVIAAAKQSLLRTSEDSKLLSAHENLISYQKQHAKETEMLLSCVDVRSRAGIIREKFQSNLPKVPLKSNHLLKRVQERKYVEKKDELLKHHGEIVKINFENKILENQTKHPMQLNNCEETLLNSSEVSNLKESNQNLLSYREQCDKEIELLTKSVNVRSRTATIMDKFQNNSDNRSSFVTKTSVCKGKFLNQSLISNQNAALFSKDNVYLKHLKSLSDVSENSLKPLNVKARHYSMKSLESNMSQTTTEVIPNTSRIINELAPTSCSKNVNADAKLNSHIEHEQSIPNNKNNILTATELVVEPAGEKLPINEISEQGTELCAAVVENDVEEINPSFCDIQYHATKKISLQPVNDQQCNNEASEAVNDEVNVVVPECDQVSQWKQLDTGKVTNCDKMLMENPTRNTIQLNGYIKNTVELTTKNKSKVIDKILTVSVKKSGSNTNRIREIKEASLPTGQSYQSFFSHLRIPLNNKAIDFILLIKSQTLFSGNGEPKQSLLSPSKVSKRMDSCDNLLSYRDQHDKEIEIFTKSVNVRSRAKTITDKFSRSGFFFQLHLFCIAHYFVADESKANCVLENCLLVKKCLLTTYHATNKLCNNQHSVYSLSKDNQLLLQNNGELSWQHHGKRTKFRRETVLAINQGKEQKQSYYHEETAIESKIDTSLLVKGKILDLPSVIKSVSEADEYQEIRATTHQNSTRRFDRSGRTVQSHSSHLAVRSRNETMESVFGTSVHSEFRNNIKKIPSVIVQIKQSLLDSSKIAFSHEKFTSYRDEHDKEADMLIKSVRLKTAIILDKFKCNLGNDSTERQSNSTFTERDIIGSSHSESTPLNSSSEISENNLKYSTKNTKTDGMKTVESEISITSSEMVLKKSIKAINFASNHHLEDNNCNVEEPEISSITSCFQPQSSFNKTEEIAEEKMLCENVLVIECFKTTKTVSNELLSAQKCLKEYCEENQLSVEKNDNMLEFKYESLDEVNLKTTMSLNQIEVAMENNSHEEKSVRCTTEVVSLPVQPTSVETLSSEEKNSEVKDGKSYLPTSEKVIQSFQICLPSQSSNTTTTKTPIAELAPQVLHQRSRQLINSVQESPSFIEKTDPTFECLNNVSKLLTCYENIRYCGSERSMAKEMLTKTVDISSKIKTFEKQSEKQIVNDATLARHINALPSPCYQPSSAKAMINNMNVQPRFVMSSGRPTKFRNSVQAFSSAIEKANRTLLCSNNVSKLLTSYENVRCSGNERTTETKLLTKSVDVRAKVAMFRNQSKSGLDKNSLKINYSRSLKSDMKSSFQPSAYPKPQLTLSKVSKRYKPMKEDTPYAVEKYKGETAANQHIHSKYVMKSQQKNLSILSPCLKDHQGVDKVFLEKPVKSRSEKTVNERKSFKNYDGITIYMEDEVQEKSSPCKTKRISFENGPIVTLSKTTSCSQIEMTSDLPIFQRNSGTGFETLKETGQSGRKPSSNENESERERVSWRVNVSDTNLRKKTLTFTGNIFSSNL